MRKILIVVDMQNDFIDGSLGSERAQAIVPRVVDMINGWGDTIIATHDTHYDNYMHTREGKYLPVEHCIVNTQGWQINESVCNALLAKGSRAIPIIKNTFGDIRLPDVARDILRINKVESVTYSDAEFHFVGLCTDICVVSNAMILKAAFPECEFYIHKDCCAGVTDESHQAALTTMKSCQMNIV